VLSRTIYKKQRGRRWLTALAMLSLVTSTFVIASSAAGFSSADFGLDKDASTNLNEGLGHVGALKTAISSTSATTFVVCELTAPPAAGSIIQIDAERMTIVSTANTTVSTGGCAFANPADVPIDARTWTVTRASQGTTAATHTGSTPRNNVTLITTGTLHDWDQVYADQVAQNDCATSGAEACVWKNRPNSGTASSSNDFTGPTTFTTTSGDLQTINQWHWTNQSVPDADEINDAFAAKYTSGHQQLMFGMDRYAVNGTKDIGFWFFHEAVGPLDDGSFSGAHCAAGQTTDGCNAPAHGDILILTTFTAGGGTTTVRAYEWVGSGGSDGALNFLTSFGDCVPGNPNDNGCATTANSTVPAPWTHTEKPTGASADTFYASGFMEGGIDLTAAGLEGCFASFMGVSRSSAQLTAQPKAFVLGHFESCSSGLETHPADGGGTLLTDTNTNDIPDTQIGTGSAGVDVTDSATITVSGTSTWTGTLHTFICGPIETGTCETGGLEIGTGTTVDQDTIQPVVSDSVNLTSAGRYCFRGFFDSGTTGVPDQTDSTTGECFEVLPVQPTLTTAAGDDVILGNAIADTATLSGTAYEPGTDGPDTDYPSINATMDTPAAGTITWSVAGPDSCDDSGLTVTGSPATVSGDGDYDASATPTAIGLYTFVAEYSGDDPNTLGAGPSGCPEGTEEVTVTGTSSLATAQDWLPNDTATLTGDTNLTGTLTFTLYNDATCGQDGGTSQYTEQVTVTDAASGTDFSTSNDSFKVNATGDYSWLVSYDDNSLTDPADSCEVTNLTITN
jgi:hypothetical protein